MKPTKLTIPLSLGDIQAETGTGLVKAQDLFQVGNTYRIKAGLPTLSFQGWLQRQDVRDYIALLEQRNEQAIIRRRGKSGGSWISLKLAIDAAMALSPQLKDEVIEVFLNHRILQWREDGGDLFLEMNTALDMAAEAVLGKPAHQGHYITLAKAISERILDEGETWNHCPAYKHMQRAQLEDRLAAMLRAGVVKDWDHLKELAEKV